MKTDLRQHEQYLARCRALGAEAAAAGESPAGALVLVDGAVVGEGRESSRQVRDVTCHAEVVAIRAACWALTQPYLAGATLYTSHEPCLLCAYVIRHVRLAGVVIGQRVPHVGGATSAFPLLTTPDIPVWGPPPVLLFVE